MLNHIIIHGRLTADPEKKQMDDGTIYCNFNVAVDRSYSKNKEADFFKCTAWRKLAETVLKYFKKGKEIVVSGSIQSNKWQDSDGNNRISWSIIASNVDFCGKKEDYEKEDQKNGNDPYEGFHEFNDNDDDIPF